MGLHNRIYIEIIRLLPESDLSGLSDFHLFEGSYNDNKKKPEMTTYGTAVVYNASTVPGKLG